MTMAILTDSPVGCLNMAWRQHVAEIRQFLVHRTGNKDDAEDLLQELFIKALHHGGAFCEIDNPRAWLFHVARNLVIDRLRLTKTQVPLPDDICAEPEPELPPIDDLSQCIPRVLSELSPVDREAILLCDLQGMTQQAYAQRVGLTLPAAKSRVLRARARLQAQLVSACQVSFDEAGAVCCFVPRPLLDSSGLD
jgi:RNA polymerase sigma-70 factor (ECF subfamily)